MGDFMKNHRYRKGDAVQLRPHIKKMIRQGETPDQDLSWVEEMTAHAKSGTGMWIADPRIETAFNSITCVIQHKNGNKERYSYKLEWIEPYNFVKTNTKPLDKRKQHIIDGICEDIKV